MINSCNRGSSKCRRRASLPNEPPNWRYDVAMLFIPITHNRERSPSRCQWQAGVQKSLQTEPLIMLLSPATMWRSASLPLRRIYVSIFSFVVSYAKNWVDHRVRSSKTSFLNLCETWREPHRVPRSFLLVMRSELEDERKELVGKRCEAAPTALKRWVSSDAQKV